MSEDEALGKAIHIVQEISICRRRYIAEVIKSLTMAAAGAITSIVALFLLNLLLSTDVVTAALTILVTLLITGEFIHLAAKKTFRYTMDTHLIGDETISLDLFVTSVALFLMLLVKNIVNAPQIVLGAPFLMVAIAKIFRSGGERGLVSGVTLLSLTLISLTLPLPRALAAMPASYTVSMIVEAMYLLSEAEECGR